MKKKKKNIIYTTLIVFASIFMCIGYAAVNSVTLNLSGISSVILPKKLFIVDVTPNENNSTTTVNLFDETFLDTRVVLNSDNSSSTLSITIKNNTSYNYSFQQIDFEYGPETYDNENIIFELSGLEQEYEIESGDSITFDLIFKYDDLTNITSNILNCKLNFNFKNTSGMKLSQLVLENEPEPTNGEDGLYTYRNSHYYSGLNVNNYIWFNCQKGYNSGAEKCEVWRILDIEENGMVRIIKDTEVEQETIALLESDSNFWHNHINDDWKASNMIASGRVRYDAKGRRPIDPLLENSYCITGSNGCNAFTSNMISRAFTNYNVDGESSIKLFLEDLYYEKVLTDSAKDAHQKSEYNIGIIDINTGKTLDSVYDAEKAIVCNSEVGLLNVSDYILASKNSNCRTNFLVDDCANDNWLKHDKEYIFLNGKVTNTNAQIFLNDTSGKIMSRDANYDAYLRPVITLRANVLATGTGTEEDYYRLAN